MCNQSFLQYRVSSSAHAQARLHLGSPSGLKHRPSAARGCSCQVHTVQTERKPTPAAAPAVYKVPTHVRATGRIVASESVLAIPAKRAHHSMLAALSCPADIGSMYCCSR